MPTVVLLDRSLSMRRPSSRDNPDQTRHSLACKGLEWFFDYMAKCFPLEFTCLLSFSSVCDVVCPFTRNYAQLKDKLEEISVLDRTDLHNALVAMVELMVADWGSFAPCQAILVTDGIPGVRHQDVVHRKQVLNIPFPCQLHVVCMATRDELSQPSWANKMDRLCEITGVSQSDVFVPSSPLCLDSVQAIFRQLAKINYKPYNAILKCGHLQSSISLSPSPHMFKSKFSLSINADHKYPKLEDSFPQNLQYPHELSVNGFLDIGSITAPPVYARHFVLDPDISDRKTERILSPGSTSSSGGGDKKPSESSEESQKPSFRVLLHGSLKCETKAALVKLGEGWFGLLFSQTSSSKKSNLVLSVFYPNCDIPWLGPLSYLGPKPTNTDPRLPTDHDKAPFPVIPPHSLSFQTPSSLLWASDSVLQGDVAKVIRYSRKLPEKEGSLVKELNKLRLVSLTYNMPDLTDVVCGLLMKEETNAANPQAKTLLQQCRLFLTNNRNPQERLAITHK